jgi:YVTN family beta-propeller protein
VQAEWFGPYRLEELIGRGGMGEVFRAMDTARKRVVALKRLPTNLAADPSYQTRFRSESEIAAQLRSAHVIPIHDYGEINGQLYIDMRLVNGEDVTDRLTHRGPMSPPAAVEVIRQTASALDAAHGMKLIHRDVKPSNILLSPEDGRDGHDFVYLVDFGIARAADRVGELTGTGGVMGTPDYMAPERFEGRTIDHAVDIYSLACVLHKMLTGVTPFQGESLAAVMYAHLTATPPRASLMRAGIPPALDWVIARGLAKDPRQRFATAGEFAAAAHAALSATTPQGLSPPTLSRPTPSGATLSRPTLSGPAPTPPTPPPAPPPARRPRRGRVIVGAVAASVVLAGAGTMGARMLQATDAPTTVTAPKSVRVSANLSVSGARTLLVDPSGTKLVLSAPARSLDTGNPGEYRVKVEVHDLADPTKITATTLSDERVDALAETPDGSTIVAASSTIGYQERKAANTLSMIDPASGKVTTSLPLPAAVIAMALSPDGQRVYLTDRSSSLQVLDMATGATVAKVPLGGQAKGLAVGKDGRQVFVAGSTGLKIVDTASHTVVGTVGLRNDASGIALTPDGKTAVAITSSNNSAVGIDLAAGAIQWTVPVGERPDSLVVTPDGQQALVASDSGGVTVIDLSTRKTSDLPVGNSAEDITLSPNGSFGFVVTFSNIVRFDREST